MRNRSGGLFAAGAAITALGLVGTYANHFHNAFHFDDTHTIVNNLFIRDLHNLPRFFVSAATFSSLPANQSYRPLVTTTLAVDYALGRGLDPFFFHLTNFAAFLVQCVLLFFLFLRWMDASERHPGNRWLALFAASLFGFHAANAETVNYIISRSDILSTLGVTAGLLAYAASPRARRFHLYLLPALLGLLAKEQAIMFAPLLFLQIALLDQQLSLGELLRPRRFWEVLRATLPAFAVTGAAALLVVRMAPAWRPAGTSRLAYLLTQPFVMVHYFITFFLPLNLSADSDWTPISNPFDDRVFIGVAFVAGMVALAARCTRSARTRPIALGVFWFFLALLPTSSFLPLAEVLNDHRLYLPYVGLTLAASWSGGLLLRGGALFQRPEKARALAIVSAGLILVAHAFGVRARNRVWASDESLWLDVAEKSPGNARGMMNYGLTRMAVGDYRTAQIYFERGLAIAPRYASLRVNMGVLEGATGQPAEAERYFREAIAYDPALPDAYYHFANWLQRVGRPAEAVPLLRRAIGLAPADLQSRHLLLQVLARLGRRDELEALALDTRRINPGDAEVAAVLAGAAPGAETPEAHLDASLAHFQAHEYEQAIAEAQRALALKPDFAEAYNNVCAAQNELRRYAEAKAACGKAIVLKPDFQLARNNLMLAVKGLSSK